MKRKIILISLIVLITFLSSLFVIYHNNTVKVKLACIDAQQGCSYTVYTQTPEEINFKYEDVLQCSIETLYKSASGDVDKDNAKEAFDTYELNLHLLNEKNPVKINSKNAKKLVMVCAKISDKQPFELHTTLKRAHK